MAFVARSLAGGVLFGTGTVIVDRLTQEKTVVAENSSPEGKNVTSKAIQVVKARQVASLPYRGLVRKHAQRQGLAYEDLYRVLEVESQWNPNAVSHSNAKGLGQFTTIAIKEVLNLSGVKINPLDPSDAIMGASILLAHLKRNLPEKASALEMYLCYNLGPTGYERLCADALAGKPVSDVAFAQVKRPISALAYAQIISRLFESVVPAPVGVGTMDDTSIRVALQSQGFVWHLGKDRVA